LFCIRPGRNWHLEFTSPVPVQRVYPEHNWSGSGRVLTPSGLVEDNVPEDSSVVLDTRKGLVVFTGCGHAGIVNIMTAVEKHYGNRPIFGIIGGLHLFAASDDVVDCRLLNLVSAMPSPQHFLYTRLSLLASPHHRWRATYDEPSVNFVGAPKADQFRVLSERLEPPEFRGFRWIVPSSHGVKARPPFGT